MAYMFSGPMFGICEKNYKPWKGGPHGQVVKAANL